jgi:hypothetical protein
MNEITSASLSAIRPPLPERAKSPPLPIAATIALEMIGPIPGTVITLRQLSSLFANVSISSVTASIPPDPLNGLTNQSGYETGLTSVTVLDGAGNQNYNFAIARVRLTSDAQGMPGEALNTRVFFRLWTAPSFDTDYNPNTTYPQLLEGNEPMSNYRPNAHASTRSASPEPELMNSDDGRR